MKIAASVILYNPDKNTISNIKTYNKYFSKIFVFDNSTKTSDVQNEIANIENVALFQNFENEGISIRLNQACEKAITEGFEWIITMDQDSFFEKETLEKYLKAFYDFENKETVSQFGCNYEQNNPKALINENDFIEVDIMITSGSLLNLKLFNTIGKFDTAYFIDQVDHDYCIRAKLMNYKTIMFPNITLSHVIGKVEKVASFATLYLLKKNRTVHGALRCYYIKRNILYLSNKFNATQIPVIMKLNKIAKYHLKQCLLYNGEYWKTRYYLKKANNDFLACKMGKISALNLKKE